MLVSCDLRDTQGSSARRAVRCFGLSVSSVTCATCRVGLRGAQYMFVFLYVLLVAALRAG
ncbi:hypothetical protein A2U01_0105683, partial [Trifolium medium]|nr:hypothetical protein [Trifolium medium]